MDKRILYALSLVFLFLSALQPLPAFASSGSGQVKLRGTIEALPAGSLVGDWLVSGQTVHVFATTQIKQEVPAGIGRLVEVKGYRQADGSINATKVEVKREKFYGYVEALPASTLVGDWTISGRIVHVTSTTKIEQKKGAVAIGAYVEVKGYSEADGSFTATKIEVKKGRSESKFYGYIEALPDGTLIGDWTISGRTVHVTATTKIEQKKGAVAIGAYVEVKGYPEADGSFTATKIEVKQGNGESKFYGYIEALPAGTLIGDWTISGRTVHVTATTQIEQEEGTVAIGAYVEVKGNTQADGSFTATKIEVKH